MKTLVLFTLVSVAVAAPAQQEGATGYHQIPQFPAYRYPEYVKRETKSPTEVKSSTVLHSSVPYANNDVSIPHQTGRSYALKTPVIVKKKSGYHLYRDSEEEKAYADSHELCGRQVKVKLCHEDEKFRELLRSSGHEINDRTSENDMKHSIIMAREAIENLQRDFRKIEQNTGSVRRDSKSDTELHEDIEVTRQALEDIHKNFENLETLSLRASTLKNSDEMQNLHFRIANTEDERMAQWKAAIENIYKNVEIAQNFEDSFKAVNDQDRLLNLDQSEITPIKGDQNIIDKKPRVALREDVISDMENDNLQITSTKNFNNVEQGSDKTMFENVKEAQEILDVVPSPSEVIEMKIVEIPSYHSLRSENFKHIEPVQDSKWELNEGEMNSFTSHEAILNRNVQEASKKSLTDMTQENKMATIDLDEKTKASHSTVEENVIKNELIDEKTTTLTPTENMKTMTEDHHHHADEGINDDNKNFHHQTENSMKMADPSNHVDLNDFRLENKHHNIDYNESEHTVALTEMKVAENSLHNVESTLFNSMKTAVPLDIPSSDIQNTHRNIDNDESQLTASLKEMKTAENILDHQLTLPKTLGDVEDSSHNSLWDHETGPMNLLKTADPSDQVALNDLHLSHKHHNIDYNESEHTAMVTDMKTAENNFNDQSIVLKSLEAKEDSLHSDSLNSQWDHLIRPTPSLKTADPLNQVHFDDLHLLDKHFNIDYNESEHTATLTEMKTAANNINHIGSILTTPENVEDNSQWSLEHETRPLISLKAADASDEVPLNDIQLPHRHHNIDYNESEHSATLTEMKADENSINQHGTIFKALEDVEDSIHHVVFDPLNSQRVPETAPLISLKMASDDHSHQASLDDNNLLRKHHKLEYDDSEHTENLIEMKEAENKFNHHGPVPKTLAVVEDLQHVVPDTINLQVYHETRPKISVKTADSSDQVPLNVIDLSHKHYHIDNNESEHAATLTEMKTAENNSSHQATVSKTHKASKDDSPNMYVPYMAPTDPELLQHVNLKVAQNLDMEPLHTNIDENESEHMKLVAEMKTSEDTIQPVFLSSNIMGPNDHHKLHPKLVSRNPQMGHESRQMSVMKIAQPLHRETLNGDHKHNVNQNKFEQTATLADLKSAEDHLRDWSLSGEKTIENELHHPESLISSTQWNEETYPSTSLKIANPTNLLTPDHLTLQEKHQNRDHNNWEEEEKLTEFKSVEDNLSSQWPADMKTVENNFHQPDTLSSNIHWNQKSHPLTSLKMANPKSHLSVDHYTLQRKPLTIDQVASEHTSKLNDLKIQKDTIHQQLMSTEMKHDVNDFDHQHSIPSTHWAHKSRPISKTVEDSKINRHDRNQMRYSDDHHFSHNNMHDMVGHGHFENSEHIHQHSTYPHRSFTHNHHHNLGHPDMHDMDVHGGVPSHFHSSLRDAMEGMESEHVFRWQPSHESFRSAYAPNPINPINSGGAVGVFPNANSGGCGIPLLLSCSPSVVSGSLAKAHGTSYSSPSYSAPSYRMEEDFGFYNKRDTKKTNDMTNNNALRSSTIIKQKTKTSLDNKM